MPGDWVVGGVGLGIGSAPLIGFWLTCRWGFGGASENAERAWFHSPRRRDRRRCHVAVGARSEATKESPCSHVWRFLRFACNDTGGRRGVADGGRPTACLFDLIGKRARRHLSRLNRNQKGS